MTAETYPRVFIVSGPSGVGKSSLIRTALQRVPRLHLSVSHTTRQPRPGEVEGKDYYFVNRERFERMIEEGAFLEWAEVYGNYYGTSKHNIQELINGHYHALLDVDTQGAGRIRNISIGAVYIFITPPSLKDLRQRLIKRGTESLESLQRRLSKAEYEIEHQNEYDHLVVNDDLERAEDDFISIMIDEARRPIQFFCPGFYVPHFSDQEEEEQLAAELGRRLEKAIVRNLKGGLHKLVETDPRVREMVRKAMARHLAAHLHQDKSTPAD